MPDNYRRDPYLALERRRGLDGLVHNPYDVAPISGWLTPCSPIFGMQLYERADKLEPPTCLWCAGYA